MKDFKTKGKHPIKHGKHLKFLQRLETLSDLYFVDFPKASYFGHVNVKLKTVC